MVDRAVTELRAYIRRENMKVGDALPSEQVLSAQLGVSRTVAREAMRALAALGVLQIGNGRRARVAAMNAEAMSILLDHTVYSGQLSIQQALDVRRTLELRIDQLHQRQVQRCLGPAWPIPRRSADPDQRALPGDRQ
ncbi:FadR/GntR family transcriptional regulator, partial [Salipiger thiooxidans]|uniref:FadR/GntR family transcriptional regulator n=1 Tax=Salipiger thiooxidans TaxID=282683 RepID=UPI00384EA8BA